MASKRDKLRKRLLAAADRPPPIPWVDGEKRINKHGYVIVKTSEGIRLEHRVIMEARIKRKLNRFEVTHHKNHNRLDNRSSNLTLESHYFHNTLALNGE